MTDCDADALNEELTRLHGQQEHAARLSALHEQAANHFANDRGTQRFHMTHAWIYALVDGDDEREESLALQLRKIGGL